MKDFRGQETRLASKEQLGTSELDHTSGTHLIAKNFPPILP